MRTLSRDVETDFRRNSGIEVPDLYFKPRCSEDPEIYVGDDAVIQRLTEIIQNVKDGIYDEETKQAIYYYGEYYQKEEEFQESSEYIKQANDMLKNYVTGWWLHSLVQNAELTEEKLTPGEEPVESGIESKQ